MLKVALAQLNLVVGDIDGNSARIVDSIRRAGDSGDDRDSVVNAFFDIRDRHSVLGTYSIDDVGDTTLNRLAGYRIRGGRPEFVTPLQAP